MSFKNLFWFAHQPADEREQGLFLKAYERMLQVILCAGIAYVWALIFSGANMLSGFTHQTMISLGCLAVVIAIVYAWWPLRHEDMAYLTVERGPKPRGTRVLLHFVVSCLVMGITVVLFPAQAVYLLFAWILELSIATRVYAWKHLTNLSAPVRLALSLFVPEIEIIRLMAITKKGRDYLGALKFIGLAIAWFVIWIVSILTIHSKLFSPVFDQEAPILYYTVNLRKAHPGDTVLATTSSTGKLLIWKSEDRLESFDGKTSFPLSEIKTMKPAYAFPAWLMTYITSQIPQ